MISVEWANDLIDSKSAILDEIEDLIPHIPTRERYLVRPGRKLKLIKSLLDVPEVERYSYPLLLLIQEFLEDRYSISFSDPAGLEDAVGDNEALWDVIVILCDLRNKIEPFVVSKDSVLELTSQDAREIRESLCDLLNRMSGTISSEDDINEEPLLDSDLYHYYEIEES